MNEPLVHPSDLIASFVIPLPYRLPSPNRRLHPLERARQVRMVRDYIALYARSKRNELKLPVATERRALRLTRFYAHPEHEMDPDNALASMKCVIDALCMPSHQRNGSGWLVDDKERYLVLYPVRQEKVAARAIGIEVLSA